MDIKNQILFSVILSLILAGAISISIGVSYQNMRDLQHQESLAADMVRGSYELSYLSNDYLVNAEPRARLQWEERYTSLQPIISQLKAGNSEEAQSLDTIRYYNEKVGTLFRGIPDPGALRPGAALFPVGYQQLTWSRMNVQSQGLIYESWRLRHMYDDDASTARFWNNILVLTLMAALLAIIGVNYLLISRRLVRSIREVNTGSEAFAAGNLKYRIPVSSDDEIGGIARRLNTMAEQIRSITASRDELNREIAERKRAEEALAIASKKLGLLSSITRHDIQNQILALRGYLDISHEFLHDTVKMQEFVEMEERAAATIDEQIAFTKEYQEMGVHAPVWQNVDATIQKAQKQFLMRNVRIDVDRSDLEIYADPLFDKVFYTLIDNALRYGGDGMTTIRVFSQETDTGLAIVCEDNGVGITEEEKKRLFEKGFGKHTGLGLFLTREILGITGISIAENGIPGKGARFEIIVPKGLYRFNKTR